MATTRHAHVTTPLTSHDACTLPAPLRNPLTIVPPVLVRHYSKEGLHLEAGLWAVVRRDCTAGRATVKNGSEFSPERVKTRRALEPHRQSHLRHRLLNRRVDLPRPTGIRLAVDTLEGVGRTS